MINKRKHIYHKTTESQLYHRCFNVKLKPNGGLIDDYYYILISPKDTSMDYNMEWSTNGAIWNILDNYYYISNSHVVYIRIRNEYAYNPSNPSAWRNPNLNISGSDYLAVAGNILTLCYGKSILNKSIEEIRNLEIPQACFENLFADNTLVMYTHNLLLPTFNVPENAYMYMFDNANIITPPIIRAYTVGNSGMLGMFYNNSSLERPPLLRVYRVDEYGMSNMFNGCTRMQINFGDPIVLPGVLGKSSCSFMFSDCHSIQQAPYMPADNLKENCYEGIFWNCLQLSIIMSSASTFNNTYGTNIYDSDNPPEFILWLSSGYNDSWLSNAGVNSNYSNKYYNFGRTPDPYNKPIYSGYGIDMPDEWERNYFTNGGWKHDSSICLGVITDYSFDFGAPAVCCKTGDWNPRDPFSCYKSYIKEYYSKDHLGNEQQWPS